MSGGQDEYWRPIVLRELAAPEPARRLYAMERISAGYVRVDAEIETQLLDALEDPGVHVFQERDWDDTDDEPGRRLVTKRKEVAAEAARVLGDGGRRERSASAIAARIETRGREASERLYRALGELGPESAELLLRDVAHPSESVRGWARAALARAVHTSTPARRLEILETAIARVSLLSESEDWLRLLESASFAFSGHGSPGLGAHIRAAGPEHETVLGWLASDLRAVRALALSVLAHRALDPRARAIVAERIAEDLPRQRDAPHERDALGHRRETVVELAIHILADAEPDALAAIRAESPSARAALRDYALFELRRPDGEGLDGARWFVASKLAARLSDDPEIADALRARSRSRT